MYVESQGVPSGFGTFRGRKAGVWAPLVDRSMDYIQICNPEWFGKPAGRFVIWENFVYVMPSSLHVTTPALTEKSTHAPVLT